MGNFYLTIKKKLSLYTNH